jgi:hypothetical protein
MTLPVRIAIFVLFILGLGAYVAGCIYFLIKMGEGMQHMLPAIQ